MLSCHRSVCFRSLTLIGLVVLMVALAVNGWAADDAFSRLVSEPNLGEFPYLSPVLDQRNIITNAYNFQMALFGTISGGGGGVATNASSALHYLAVTAVLIGALLIVFNPKQRKLMVIVPWLVLVVITVFAPYGSKLLFYPLSPTGTITRGLDGMVEESNDCGSYSKNCGFTPQLAALHGASVLQLALSDLFNSLGWRTLIGETLAKENLRNNPKFVSSPDWPSKIKEYAGVCGDYDFPKLMEYRRGGAGSSVSDTKIVGTLGDQWRKISTPFIAPLMDGKEIYPPQAIQLYDESDYPTDAAWQTDAAKLKYSWGITNLYAAVTGRQIPVHLQGNVANGNIDVATALKDLNENYGFFDVQESQSWWDGSRPKANTGYFFFWNGANAKRAEAIQKRQVFDGTTQGAVVLSNDMREMFENPSGAAADGTNWKSLIREKALESDWAMNMPVGVVSFNLMSMSNPFTESERSCLKLGNRLIDEGVNFAMGARGKAKQLEPLRALLVGDGTGTNYPSTIPAPSDPTKPTLKIEQLLSRSLACPTSGSCLYEDTRGSDAKIAQEFINAYEVAQRTKRAQTGENLTDQERYEVLLKLVLDSLDGSTSAFVKSTGKSELQKAAELKAGEDSTAVNLVGISAISTVGGWAAIVLGDVVTGIASWLTGPLTKAIVYFISLLVDMALLLVIVLTPILFLIGLVIPSTAVGLLTVSILGVFVLKAVPITLLVLNNIGGMVYEMIGVGGGENGSTMQNLMILAMAGLYANLVGMTFFLLFKLGDPATIMGRFTAIDGAGKNVAERGVAAAVAAATTLGLLASGPIGAAIGRGQLGAASRLALQAAADKVVPGGGKLAGKLMDNGTPQQPPSAAEGVIKDKDKDNPNVPKVDAVDENQPDPNLPSGATEEELQFLKSNNEAADMRRRLMDEEGMSPLDANTQILGEFRNQKVESGTRLDVPGSDDGGESDGGPMPQMGLSEGLQTSGGDGSDAAALTDAEKREQQRLEQLQRQKSAQQTALDEQQRREGDLPGQQQQPPSGSNQFTPMKDSQQEGKLADTSMSQKQAAELQVQTDGTVTGKPGDGIQQIPADSKELPAPQQQGPVGPAQFQRIGEQQQQAGPSLPGNAAPGERGRLPGDPAPDGTGAAQQIPAGGQAPGLQQGTQGSGTPQEVIVKNTEDFKKATEVQNRVAELQTEARAKELSEQNEDAHTLAELVTRAEKPKEVADILKERAEQLRNSTDETERTAIDAAANEKLKGHNTSLTMLASEAAFTRNLGDQLREKINVRVAEIDNELRDGSLKQERKDELKEEKEKLLTNYNPIHMVQSQLIGGLAQMEKDKSLRDIKGAADNLPSWGASMWSGLYGAATGAGGGLGKIPILGPAISEVFNERLQAPERARAWKAYDKGGGTTWFGVGKDWWQAKDNSQRMGFYQKEMSPLASAQQYESMLAVGGFQVQADLARQTANEAVAKSRSQFEAMIASSMNSKRNEGLKPGDVNFTNYMSIDELRGLGRNEAADRVVSVRQEALTAQGETLKIERAYIKKDGKVTTELALDDNMKLKLDANGKPVEFELKTENVALTPQVLDKLRGDKAMKRIAGGQDEMVIESYGLIEKQYLRGNAGWDKSRHMTTSVEGAAAFVREDVGLEYTIGGHLNMVTGKYNFKNREGQYKRLLEYRNDENRIKSEIVQEVMANPERLEGALKEGKFDASKHRVGSYDYYYAQRVALDKYAKEQAKREGRMLKLDGIYDGIYANGFGKYEEEALVAPAREASRRGRLKDTLEREYKRQLDEVADLNEKVRKSQLQTHVGGGRMTLDDWSTLMVDKIRPAVGDENISFVLPTFTKALEGLKDAGVVSHTRLVQGKFNGTDMENVKLMYTGFTEKAFEKIEEAFKNHPFRDAIVEKLRASKRNDGHMTYYEVSSQALDASGDKFIDPEYKEIKEYVPSKEERQKAGNAPDTDD